MFINNSDPLKPVAKTICQTPCLNSFNKLFRQTYFRETISYFIIYLGIDVSFSCEAKIGYSTYLENTFSDYSIV